VSSLPPPPSPQEGVRAGGSGHRAPSNGESKGKQIIFVHYWSVLPGRGGGRGEGASEKTLYLVPERQIIIQVSGKPSV
jgi:hypothetical protein